LNGDKCLCAFCGLERRVYRKRHLSLINVVLAFLTSTTLGFAFWQKWDARVLFISVVAVFLEEIFIQMRWRLTLACPYCGFDPITYLRDPDQAAKKVKVRLEQARNSPTLVSAHNPWSNLGPLIAKASKSRRNIREKRERSPMASLDLPTSEN
ncbi:MAG: hypothetical protein KDD35_11015, partial [Bdellovibrionales bacterium]|nr:hypothetical protein [Bdellovibrionales bacterium]